MPNFVGEQIVKQLVLAGKRVRDAKIVFFGATFKENCPDVRNSKIMEILKYFEQFEMKPLLVDTWADPAEVKRGYGYDLDSEKNSYDADCIVLAVAHEGYKNRSLKEWDSFFKPGDNSEKVIIDIKGILDNSEVTEAGYRYWRL